MNRWQDFHREHSPHFALSVILPTYIGGPNILPLVKGVDSFSYSQGVLWKTATDPKLIPVDWPGWVDVRDVAKAHVNILINPEAAGKRWLVSAGMFTYSDVSRQPHEPCEIIVISILMALNYIRLRISFGVISRHFLRALKFKR